MLAQKFSDYVGRFVLLVFYHEGYHGCKPFRVVRPILRQGAGTQDVVLDSPVYCVQQK